jgi:thiamine biosynthesis lipoprotein
MATLFEFLLEGDDEENLAAVGEAALDEVTRIEQMISMHDPTSELARVNREAYAKPVAVTRELFDLLKICRIHHGRTGERFDPCHGTPLPYGIAVDFDDSTRGILFTHSQTRIDLGGYGKGYALDLAAGLIQGVGCQRFLLHGGTSSIHAAGKWPVALRSPGSNEPLGTITIDNESLSCSAAGSNGTAVIASSGQLAEAWSTAILAAGREGIYDFRYDDIIAAAWVDSEIHWIEGQR